MTIPSATKVDWDQYILDLLAFSVAIEKKDSGGRSYKDALNTNVNSDKSSKKVIDSILDIPITDKGFVPPEFCNTMSDDKKKEFYKMKKGFMEDKNVSFKMNSKCKGDGDKSKSSHSRSSGNKKLQRQVQSLKKELKSKKKKGSDDSDDSSD